LALLASGKALENGTEHITCNAIALFNSDGLAHSDGFKEHLRALENSNILSTKMLSVTSSNQNIPMITGTVSPENYIQSN
jgi:hypothetical protein